MAPFLSACRAVPVLQTTEQLAECLPSRQKVRHPENSSKSHRREAEPRRASCENSQPSGLQDGWFPAFEISVAPFSFTHLVRAKMEERHALSLCLSASPRLFELPVLGSFLNLKNMLDTAKYRRPNLAQARQFGLVMALGVSSTRTFRLSGPGARRISN